MHVYYSFSKMETIVILFIIGTSFTNRNMKIWTNILKNKKTDQSKLLFYPLFAFHAYLWDSCYYSPLILNRILTSHALLPPAEVPKMIPPAIILSYLCKKTLLLKDQGNFDNICISKEELLGDIAVMPVFCINNAKNTKNKWLCQLVIRFLLMNAFAELFLGDSVQLLYFSESGTRSRRSAKVPISWIYCYLSIIYVKIDMIYFVV